MTKSYIVLYDYNALTIFFLGSIWIHRIFFVEKKWGRIVTIQSIDFKIPKNWFLEKEVLWKHCLEIRVLCVRISKVGHSPSEYKKKTKHNAIFRTYFVKYLKNISFSIIYISSCICLNIFFWQFYWFQPINSNKFIQICWLNDYHSRKTEF